MKAYPSYEWVKAHGQMMAVGGMDLRDYFAARTLQAIMSNPTNRDLASESLIAKTAYLYADAMMKAREAK